MNWIIKKIVGSKNERDLKKMEPMVAAINALDETFQSLSDEELQSKTADFRKRLAAGETVKEIELEAFAVVKNAARRLCGSTIQVCGHDLAWEMVHFDVQLIGGMAIHNGMVEMATGEEKRLSPPYPFISMHSLEKAYTL